MMKETKMGREDEAMRAGRGLEKWSKLKSLIFEKRKQIKARRAFENGVN